MDDTVQSPEEVADLTNAPLIGYLSEQNVKDEGALYVAENPRHPSVEEIRTLRANLEFAGVDQPLNTILVSSVDMEVGKTSVAANLAAAMSQAEKDVILLDGDLRRPNVHNYYGFQNNIGLSDVFRGEYSIDQVIKNWPGGPVSVISAGEPPPNPSELLGSRKMSRILESLSRSSDIVIIDGPPFIVADAPILASKVNGVLLIIQLGHTRKPSIKGMMEQINRSGAKVVGVVLNRLPTKSVGYYTGNPKNTSYYTDGSGSRQRRRKPRLSIWPFNRQSKSESGSVSPRVFDEIDFVEGESDGFGWRE
jgi:capsular exopolysaccharide synthesis family protein